MIGCLSTSTSTHAQKIESFYHLKPSQVYPLNYHETKNAKFYLRSIQEGQRLTEKEGWS